MAYNVETVKGEIFVIATPKIAGTKRKAQDANQKPQRLPRPTHEVATLIEAISGRTAFNRLRSMIQEWRDRSRPLFEDNNNNMFATYVVQFISAWEKRSQLAQPLNRCGKVMLAGIIHENAKDRIRADPEAITKLMGEIKWEITKENRTTLNEHLKEGRRWKRVCGDFNGLLLLIPPNQESISASTYFGLSEQDMKSFHSLLRSDTPA